MLSDLQDTVSVTIKAVLISTVYAICMDYLEGLTDVDQEIASHLRQWSHIPSEIISWNSCARKGKIRGSQVGRLFHHHTNVQTALFLRMDSHGGLNRLNMVGLFVVQCFWGPALVTAYYMNHATDLNHNTMFLREIVCHENRATNWS